MKTNAYVRHSAFPVASLLTGLYAAGASGVKGGIAAANLTLTGLAELAKTAAKTAVVAPAALGLGGGYIAAKLSSPSATDLDVQEKQIVNARLKTMAASNVRRLAADLAERQAEREKRL